MKRSTIHADRIFYSISNAAGCVFSLAFVAVLLFSIARADAAMVSGVYASDHGKPLAGRQLHFDNLVSGDIFLARTESDGAFKVDLPSGSYDLRDEHGVVVVPKILISDQATNLGQVGRKPQPLEMVLRPFERQGVAAALVNSSAPATAHLAVSSATESSADSAPSQSGAIFYTPDSHAAAPSAPPPPPRSEATFYAPGNTGSAMDAPAQK